MRSFLIKFISYSIILLRRYVSLFNYMKRLNEDAMAGAIKQYMFVNGFGGSIEEWLEMVAGYV